MSDYIPAPALARTLGGHTSRRPEPNPCAPPDSVGIAPAGSPETARATETAPSRTLPPSDPCPSCASLRYTSTLLSDLALEQLDILRAVRRYADECQGRAGATVDPLTVAASLRTILAGLELSCPACAARRVEERRG